MTRGQILAAFVGCGLVVCTLWAQDPFREYPAWEYNNFPLPPDYKVPAEWTIACPVSARPLALASRRLTRIAGKSAEQPSNLEQDDDVFNYPWLYAVEVGHWELTAQTRLDPPRG